LHFAFRDTPFTHNRGSEPARRGNFNLSLLTNAIKMPGAFRSFLAATVVLSHLTLQQLRGCHANFREEGIVEAGDEESDAHSVPTLVSRAGLLNETNHF
jgi:hypothetical protein